MNKKNAADPRVPPYVIKPLAPADRPRVLAHLLKLDEADRSLRFGVVADEAAIARYVDSIAFDGRSALGVADTRGALIGFAHVPFDNGIAELGISIDRGRRQRGIALALTTAALRGAQAAGAREFRFHCAASNEGMRRLAQHLGMAIEADGSDITARLVLGGGDGDEPTPAGVVATAAA